MATATAHPLAKFDDFMTPRGVWEMIAPYVPKDKTISMPFYGDGACAHHMRELGFDVIHQDEDFFENDRGQIVVDNPPFSDKRKVIQKLVERNKPFMLLLPVSTICYAYSSILKDHMQIMVLPRRPRFIRWNSTTGEHEENWEKKNPAFDCIWLCWKMRLPKDIIHIT